MNQDNIRDFNNVTYTVPEGSAIVKELDDRTKHNVDGYNSIAELGAKLKALIDGAKPTTLYNGQILHYIKHPDNNPNNDFEQNDFVENLVVDNTLIVNLGQYLGGDKSDINNIDQLSYTRIQPI